MSREAPTQADRTAAHPKSSADGWRGTIGGSFTREIASRIAAAVLDEWEGAYPIPARVLITHDARALGDAVAADVALLIAARPAHHVVTLVRHLPTSTASYLTRGDFDLAIVITASHNGPGWNGLKLKLAPGVSAPPDMVSRVDARIAEARAVPETADVMFRPPTLDPASFLAIHAAAAVARCRNEPVSRFRVAVDGLGGIAESGILALGQRLGWRVHPSGRPVEAEFGGCIPDPSRSDALEALSQSVLRVGADFGIALDGDGDRIYILDDAGCVVLPHDLMALLALYEHEHAAGIATMAVTQSTGAAARAAAKAIGAELIETPIGFKHIGTLLASGRVDVGGGGVGDLAFRTRSSDRDPLCVAAHVAELLADRGRPLSEEVDDLRRFLGTAGLHWVELHFPAEVTLSTERKHALLRRAAAASGIEHLECETLAGGAVRAHGAGLQWVMLRASTTEGGLRLYGEILARGGDPRAAIRSTIEDGLQAEMDQLA